MMQNVAALKTDLATSILPLEGLNNPVSRDNQALGNPQTPQRDAFEDAMSRARDSSDAQRQQHSRNDSIRDQQVEQQRTQQREEQRSQQAQAKEDQVRSMEKNQEYAAQLDKKRDAALERAENKQTDQNLKSEQIKDGKSQEVSQNAGSLEKVDAAQVTDNADLKQKNIKNDLYIDPDDRPSEITEDFNWVEFVNQVKDVNGKETLKVESSKNPERIPNDLFSQFIKDQQQIIDEGNKQQAFDAQTNKDFLIVSLSDEDIAAVLTAQGVNIENDIVADPEKLAALDKAVAKILAQFNDNQSTSSVKTDTPEQSELDSALLKNLLGASKEVDSSALELPTEEPLVEDIMKQQLVADKPAVTIKNDLHVETQLKVSGSAKPLENPDIKTSLPEQTGDVMTPLQAATNTSQTDASKTQEKAVVVNPVSVASKANLPEPTPEPTPEQLETNDVSPIVNAKALEPLPIKLEVPKSTSNKQALELLTKLPDENLDVALQNINKRVAEVVTEVKTETKGAEFIAALQAGVKEIKEQMKQGREPGIDLKQLVAEALAKTDTVISSTQQEVKIDKHLTQVTNLLGAASSITQNSAQIANASLGLGEINLQKEISQVQVENAKSLNQTTSPNDKAVNIMKPDGQTQLAEKVRWMVNNRSLTAEIRLDPPDLGGMQIKVAMSGEAASVNFTVQSQHARDVLEQAAPQLRDMLEESGIALGDSHVEQENGEQTQQFAGNDNSGTSSANNSSNDDAVRQNDDLVDDDQGVTQRIINGRIGGIDSYV